MQRIDLEISNPCNEHCIHCYRHSINSQKGFLSAAQASSVMEQAKKLGAGALFITGNVDFYGKSGFVPAKNKGVRYADDPDADYFLVKELIPGVLDELSGTYRDPEGYFSAEKNPAAFAAFEATFPEKEKLRLPGQLFLGD